MEKIFSRIIAYLFHPMLMPTLGVFVMFNSGTPCSIINYEAKLYLYLVVFIFTFAFPLILIPFFLFFKVVKSFALEEKKERIFPIILTIIIYSAGFYMLYDLPIPEIIIAFYFSVLVTLIILLGITFFWKVSAHMAGIGGIIGLLLIMSARYEVNLLFYLIIAFFISGLIGYSRLSLRSHNILQITSGFFLGLIVVSATLMIY